MLAELRDWFDRGRALVPPEDRKILLEPHRLIARFMKFALHHSIGAETHATADDVRARDPAFVLWIGELWRLLAKYYFRLRTEGVANVPARGPVLLVGNHNGGFVPSEGFFVALALYEQYGPERALYALAHDFLFEDPTLRRYAGRLGLLRAGHESARHAFAAGACVLVYPGSDMDTFRPFRDRNKVVLAGRKGFLKLALRERVPIVPVVSAGAHEQFIVLTRGDKLAHLIHAHRWWRAEVLPIVLSLPWGLTSGFFPYLPLPTQITLSFLPSMTWPDASPDRPEDLERCYRDVEAAMQAELDRLTRDRRFLLGPREAPAPQRVRETTAPPAGTPGMERAARRVDQPEG